MQPPAFAIFCMMIAALTSLSGCTAKKADKNSPIPPGEYTVVEEDDLTHVALRAYGDGELWFTLLNANPYLAKRPRFDLQPGDVLVIPKQADLDKSLPKSVFPEQLPADYIVMPGDSLHFIAGKIYGDRELWPRIYEANRNVLSERVKEDTRRLIAGQVLHLPAPPAPESADKAESP
jgi:nucleoid-associated protein YgaU